MNRLLESRRDSITALCKRHQVAYLAAFGSVTEDRFTAESDIDLLVRFHDGISAAEYATHYFELKASLEQLLGRSVDLVTEHALSNPWFRQSVERQQQALYAA